MDKTTLWISFNVFIVILLVIDLGIFNKRNHSISLKEALIWSCVWIALAFCFNVFVYYYFGEKSAFEFFTGYLIEKSLSVDNLFVMVLIFSYFNVPDQYQHKVLFWGIFGALILRVIFILSGIELIHQFHWLIYVFGLFLVFTGLKMFTSDGLKIDPDKNPVIRVAKKLFRVTPSFEGAKFFVRKNNQLWATPLFLVVVLIEFTDLIFAVDSIPAIIAITDDAFIVYTSNVFAILGLRSLYFALAGIHRYFTYLKHGLAVILVFVGVKMSCSDFIKIPIEISLAFIITTLSIAVLTSMVLAKKSDTDS